MCKYVRWISKVGPRIIKDHFRYIKPFYKHKDKHSLEERYSRLRELFITVLNVMRLDIKIHGIENLRKLEEEGKTFFLVSNHISDMDPLPLVYLSEKPLTFIAKKETAKYPIVNKAIVDLDGFFLDREDLKQSLRVMKDVKDRLGHNDLSIGIFPEGKRNKEPDGPIKEFHPGSFRPAINSNSYILPVAIFGTHRVLQSKYNFKRFPIEITILPPLGLEFYSGKKSQDIAPEINKMINDEVDKMKMIDKEFIEKGYHKIPLKKGQIPGRDSVLMIKNK